MRIAARCTPTKAANILQKAKNEALIPGTGRRFFLTETRLGDDLSSRKATGLYFGWSGNFVSPTPLMTRTRPLSTSPLPASAQATESEEDKKKKKRPAIDSRVWPIAASTLVGGCAVGVLFPVMPIFAQELGLSQKDFGLVVSIVGLTRLLVNVPAAWATDKYGRRSTLIGGPIVSGVAMALTATASSLTELVTFRFMTGMGGAFQMTGAQMYLSDISTPENRARTMAPMGIAFATGATIGPALGGLMTESYGLRSPFYFVTTAIMFVALLNYRLVPETKVFDSSTTKEIKTVREEIKALVEQWKPLMRDSDMRRVLGLHMTYWSVASGCQWTLLPLIASSQFGFSVSDLGGMFAMLSAIGIVGLGPAAYVSDKFGRKATIFPASVIVASALCGLTVATTKEELLGLVALYGLGATLFNSTPSAFVADITNEKTRGQALALLRSAGDAGLFVGASGFGLMASMTTNSTALATGSVALVLAGANFVFRKSIRSPTNPIGGILPPIAIAPTLVAPAPAAVDASLDKKL